MTGSSDQRGFGMSIWIGVAAWILGAAGVGCQRSESPGASEALRHQFKSTVETKPLPADSPSVPATPEAPAKDQVRRFAVRPFEEWTMRETAAAALGRIGKPAVPQLVQALQSTNPTLRHQAADTLARIGPSAAEAVPALVQAMDDPDPLVRKAAARALGQIGPDAADAVPKLIEMLLEDDRG